MLRLRSVGRRSGVERTVVIAYYLDGDALVTIAMNGWAKAQPGWLYNLRANPHAMSWRENSASDKARLLAGGAEAAGTSALRMRRQRSSS